MKKSISLCRSYCQLLRQWARFSTRHRTQIPLSACSAHIPAVPQVGSTGQLWQHQNMISVRQMCTTTEEISEADQEEEGFEDSVNSVPLTHNKTNILAKFRTDHDDPVNHTIEHEGMFYRVSNIDYRKYIEPGQWTRYKEQVKTFQECVIMVRQPALEVFDFVDNANLDYPPMKILLYGKNGSGKTMTLAHVVHRYAKAGWLTIHLPDVLELIRFWKTVERAYSLSTYKEGRYDYTDDAVAWLKYFKRQNIDHLKNIKTTKEYIWSQREKSPEGSDLLDIIEFGISRKKYASDCIGVAFREIKLQASEKQLKVLVAVDGVNGFWKNTSIRDEKKRLVNAQKVSTFQHFQKLFNPDWTRGVCVGTVCACIDAVDDVNLDKNKVPYTPHYLLKQRGFDFMDPFIPVLVPEYSVKEAHNCIDYYIERKWIIKPRGLTEEGKKELIMLSNKNPCQLMDISASW